MGRPAVPLQVHGGGRFLLRRRDFIPAYLRAHEAGLLHGKVEQALSHLGPSCRACPRLCKGVDRRANHFGVCKVGWHARVASAFPHFGEEDVLRGWHGSGTIFFSFCNLRCVFCQNFQTSQVGEGQEVDAMGLSLVRSMDTVQPALINLPDLSLLAQCANFSEPCPLFTRAQARFDCDLSHAERATSLSWLLMSPEVPSVRRSVARRTAPTPGYLRSGLRSISLESHVGVEPLLVARRALGIEDFVLRCRPDEPRRRAQPRQVDGHGSARPYYPTGFVFFGRIGHILPNVSVILLWLNDARPATSATPKGRPGRRGW
jgi:hypothetical protein